MANSNSRPNDYLLAFAQKASRSRYFLSGIDIPSWRQVKTVVEVIDVCNKGMPFARGIKEFVRGRVYLKVQSLQIQAVTQLTCNDRHHHRGQAMKFQNANLAAEDEEHVWVKRLETGIQIWCVRVGLNCNRPLARVQLQIEDKSNCDSTQSGDRLSTRN